MIGAKLRFICQQYPISPDECMREWQHLRLWLIEEHAYDETRANHFAADLLAAAGDLMTTQSVNLGAAIDTIKQTTEKGETP